MPTNQKSIKIKAQYMLDSNFTTVHENGVICSQSGHQSSNGGSTVGTKYYSTPGELNRPALYILLVLLVFPGGQEPYHGNITRSTKHLSSQKENVNIYLTII